MKRGQSVVNHYQILPCILYDHALPEMLTQRNVGVTAAGELVV